VLIPPLVLIFLVLGTIFLGVATPTEGGAMGALGALIMSMARRRLTSS
jgi:TRAP-type mannitol/chloroaromatic compound transport system permease large subunit